MELEPEIVSELLCDVVEEVPWKKVAQGVRAVLREGGNTIVTGTAAPDELCNERSSTKPKGDFMEPFNEKDAGTIEQLKDAMAARALEGDAAAAAAFASLLNAETARQKTLMAPKHEKPAGASGPSTWTETLAGKQTDTSLAAVA
jgi:hypothetical protein